ncbi:hypothetical protein ACFL2K_04925 [Candidatus Margulisiibacteriota bacterium]
MPKIKISKKEYELIQEIITLEGGLDKTINNAKEFDNCFELLLDETLFQELLNNLASEANHEESKSRERKLDNLFIKLEGYKIHL